MALRMWAWLAMDHLWQRGHRAIICVSDSRTYDGRLRIDRYERYTRDHGAAERSTSSSPTRSRPRPTSWGQRIFGELVQPATAV
jgi:DNA-binding LacI/PurR family transcriptional regulator